MEKVCLVLDQYRESKEYNDFIGKLYHFPKKYLNYFTADEIEFIYYEPKRNGKGVFYGSGKIHKKPIEDKSDTSKYYVEIENYKPFKNEVPFENEDGPRETAPYYNPQNAVRQIKVNVLEEICLDGGILLNFKADAHLVQVLGEQLIASERVGILELVKNAFDAGASYCKVRIENVPNLIEVPESIYEYKGFAGPVIVIEDDGCGMTKEQIEMGWLRPASTIKTNIKERLKKEKDKATKEGKLGTYNTFLEEIKNANQGRIPLGEKGVGRFACHRLGSKLLVKTKVVENDYEYILKIDWDDFNLVEGKYKNLDDINVSLSRQKPSRDYGIKSSGTQLIIYGGREGFELTDTEIKEINSTILKLNSPNPDPNIISIPFKASFSCPQVKELDEQITYEKYDPVFKINGLVDELGNFEYDYFFNPPYNVALSKFEHLNEKIDLKTRNSDYWFQVRSGMKVWRRPSCGAFYININIWYRDNPWIDKSDKDFLEYLKKYGGISVYRDGINVFPAEWGTESDWLELRQRQLQQTYRLSYYHMIGNVEINQSTNINLIDKTNREGMVKNRAFLDLTELVKSITHFVETDYIEQRNKLNKLSDETTIKNLGNFSNQSAEIILNINKNYDVALDQYKLFENIQQLRDKSERREKLVELTKSLKNMKNNLERIQEIQDMLVEQAGFGLGIAVALHEIEKTTSNFYYSILDVIESRKFDKLKLESLKDTSKALESEIMRLSPLRTLRNEEPIQYKVSKSIKYVHSVFKRRFKELGIGFSYNHDQDFEIIARFGALNQILTNLLDNSCYWMDKPEITERKIKIEINSLDRTIIVADSGPGIHDSILSYLFQPGASLKSPPSGLGLYICKHYMNLMKKRGDIYLAKERDRIQGLDGAQFLLDFSKVIYKKDEK